VAPPPPDGSTGCVATIRRLMRGAGHTVPCGTARQATVQARWVAGHPYLKRKIGCCPSLGKQPAKQPSAKEEREEEAQAVASTSAYFSCSLQPEALFRCFRVPSVTY
jgi:hypothetical protein